MHPNCPLLIGCCGYFLSAEFLDGPLFSQFSIPTRTGAVRIVRVPDRSRQLVAIGHGFEFHDVDVYDIESREKLSRFPKHKESVFGLAAVSSASSEDSLIISGGWTGDLFLSEASTGREIGDLCHGLGSLLRITHVCEWPENFFVGGTLVFRRYDLNRLEARVDYKMQLEQAYGIGFSTQRNLLFTASFAQSNEKSKARMWEKDDHRKHCGLMDIACGAFSCCFDETTSSLFVGLRNGDIEMWDIRRMDQKLTKFQIATNRIREIIPISRNHYLSCSDDNSVIVWSNEAKVCNKTSLQFGVFGVCSFGQYLEDDFFLIEDEVFRFLTREAGENECCSTFTCLISLTLLADQIGFWRFLLIDTQKRA